MKRHFSLAILSFLFYSSYGQTNTFPGSGNVGIGTLSPVSKLQVDGELNGASSINIGKASSPGKRKRTYGRKSWRV